MSPDVARGPYARTLLRGAARGGTRVVTGPFHRRSHVRCLWTHGAAAVQDRWMVCRQGDALTEGCLQHAERESLCLGLPANQ